jgi:hypothetical protein
VQKGDGDITVGPAFAHDVLARILLDRPFFRVLGRRWTQTEPCEKSGGGTYG